MISLRIMKNIKKHFNYILITVMAVFSFGIAAPFTSTAGAACSGSDSRVFGFPVWYKGLPGTCKEPKIENLNDFWVIVMNFIEILILLVAYVAAGFILWGGFKYIKSEGDPGKIAEAKTAILYAIVGLVVALGSVAIVQFVQGGLIT